MVTGSGSEVEERSLDNVLDKEKVRNPVCIKSL